ncbi:hypothetical protein WJ63_28535 [Burkholderia pyrrocinia]|nr:hypothetical protein WJ63_28535 [Burkholderia pyrrocinia]
MPTQPMDCLVESSFGLIVQGMKRMIRSGGAYVYDANRFMTIANTAGCSAILRDGISTICSNARMSGFRLRRSP